MLKILFISYGKYIIMGLGFIGAYSITIFQAIEFTRSFVFQESVPGQSDAGVFPASSNHVQEGTKQTLY